MTFQDDRESQRRRKSDPEGDNILQASDQGARRPRKKRVATSEVGDALRTVYQRAVDEDIPPEMLDLLGKLG